MGDSERQDAAEHAQIAGDALGTAPSIEEVQQVDIHKPKPVHGWREFINEIGVIVIGVLIALGAEQVVEALHWHHVVTEESEALDEEAKDIWGAMSSRVVQQPCIDRRLSELAQVFANHDAGRQLNLIAPVGRPRVFTAARTALQIATADGSLSHMSLKQKQTYFAVYENYDTFQPSANEERASWRALQALDHASTLSDVDWRELRKAYDDAVDSNVTMKYNLVMGDEGQWLTSFKKFPRWPVNRAALTLPSVVELCRPALAARAPA